MIEDPNRPGYGWQFDLQDGSAMQTCAPCQIQFVRDRKNRDKDFRTLVRLDKKWRNHAELKALKSFTIELIMAHILDTEGTTGTHRRALPPLSALRCPVGPEGRRSVPGERGRRSARFTDPVVILDPVYSLNNVASRITEAERERDRCRRADAWEAAHFASAEDDDEVWKEIFGPRFRIEEAA